MRDTEVQGFYIYCNPAECIYPLYPPQDPMPVEQILAVFAVSTPLQKKQKNNGVQSCSIGNKLAIHNSINCGTNNVVYSVEYTSCNLQYVVCTMRMLRTRNSKQYHGASYSSDKGLSNVSKHFKYHHSGTISTFVFFMG